LTSGRGISHADSRAAGWSLHLQPTNPFSACKGKSGDHKRRKMQSPGWVKEHRQKGGLVGEQQLAGKEGVKMDHRGN